MQFGNVGTREEYSLLQWPWCGARGDVAVNNPRDRRVMVVVGDYFGGWGSVRLS